MVGTWEKLGLLPELASAVRTLGFATPSAPQRLAVPSLLTGRSLAFASSTGSGKTLAFLLPVMQQLKLQEIAQPLLGQEKRCRPRAIVLAPTRDLTTQIGAVAKEVSQIFRLRVRTAEGGTKLSRHREKLASGADMLVATPDRLRLLHQLGDVSLRDVRHFVVDEADDMLLRGFEGPLRELLRKCPPRLGDPPSPQLTFVSATLGSDVRHSLKRTFPDVEMLIGSCAHRAPPTLRHEIVPFQGDRLNELQAMLASDRRYGDAADGEGEARPRTLIFCRGVQSARAVQHALSEAGLPVAGCHGQMPDDMRRRDVARFVADPPRKPLLVCTDYTARGMDFPGVERVINFDFPATSALYLHRAGRTARMGRPGEVVSLVHTSERRFAESIRDAVLRQAELHTVRKGDLRERQRARGAEANKGRATARALMGREAAKLRRMAPERRQAARAR